MDYGLIYEADGDTVVCDVRNFSLQDILDNGQCFRWSRVDAGDDRVTYTGIALGRHQTVTQRGDVLTFADTTPEEVEALWLDYFDLRRDYGRLKEWLSADPILARAIAYAPGIRVLNQPRWETLCSFILSQNNNIIRIRGLVERLCSLLGDAIPGGFDFPGPEKLAGLAVEALSPVRAGFRAKYLLDAADKVTGGEIDLDAVAAMPTGEARSTLQRINGVGPKVAECALLYGFGRAECVPVDVWVRRILETLYPGGFPAEYEPVAGLAQQYLFHYARTCPGALEAPVSPT
ncbi:DNA-3-methyladenine glycosylase 2 family protein [Ruminococcaceae bacterium OttesenSCG-928-L11]|nr:DNA-3-methyladenine glycosylase 2 family protein [Ruminococcaceae bacterium OttesenSCG-928-L11]